MKRLYVIAISVGLFIGGIAFAQSMSDAWMDYLTAQGVPTSGSLQDRQLSWLGFYAANPTLQSLAVGGVSCGSPSLVRHEVVALDGDGVPISVKRVIGTVACTGDTITGYSETTYQINANGLLEVQ